MLVDPVSQILYVFGGRVITPDPSQIIYSGLYSYNIVTNQWKMLFNDQTENIMLKSRIGHSMLHNPDSKELYIFAGQRHKDYLSDFYVYSLVTGEVTELSRDYSKQGGPDAGFTQRATIDLENKELYVLSGLMREKHSTSETVKNSFWCYSITKQKWRRVYQNENLNQEYWLKMASVEPRPRFAHQMVYDPKTRLQYLFGGNPGENGNPNLRLDDFWTLTLTRPSTAVILRRCKFKIRRQKFFEMANCAPKQALEYLQQHVSLVVDHTDPSECAEFRKLASMLFKWGEPVKFGRIDLFEDLQQHFPANMRQPKENLVDLVKLV
jgi:hypothetical protein